MQITGVTELPVEAVEAALQTLRDEGVEVNVSAVETYIG